MTVSWGYYPQYMENKKKLQTTNQYVYIDVTNLYLAGKYEPPNHQVDSDGSNFFRSGCFGGQVSTEILQDFCAFVQCPIGVV